MLPCALRSQGGRGFLRSSGNPRFVFGHQIAHGGDETGFGLVVASRLLHRLFDGVQPSIKPFTGPAGSGVRTTSLPSMPSRSDSTRSKAARALAWYAFRSDFKDAMVSLSWSRWRFAFGASPSRLRVPHAVRRAGRDGFSQPFPSVKHQASQQLGLDFGRASTSTRRWHTPTRVKAPPWVVMA